MKQISALLCCLFLCGFLSLQSIFAKEEKTKAAQGSEISDLVGKWTGESVCVNKERFPACKYEHVIYRIEATSGKSNTVSITMDKIVNNKPETMGVADFAYDRQKGMLTTEFKNNRVHLTVEFAVKGDVMEGTVTSLPDRELVRRISLKKEE